MTEQARNLVAELLSECGETASDDNIDAFAGNQGEALIEDAASGDVQALVELRTKCGLPLLR